LIELYKEFSIDLKISNGTNNWELPVPATYIISREGIILFSWLDLDYTKRVEPEDIYALLSDKN
jgi:peroxiredoxin